MIGGPRLTAALFVAAAAVSGPVAAAEPLAHRTDLSPEDRLRVARVLAPPTDASAAEPFEAMAGGAPTSRAAPGPTAFAQPSATLGGEAALRFQLGRAVFQKLWVAAPASTHASDGLGPLYNARACAACHVRDGRGHPAGEGEGFLVKLSVPGPDGAARPDPVYGGQLQDRAVTGLAGEGRVTVAWTLRTVTLAGGDVVGLRAPTYVLADPAYGPPGDGLVLAPRIAPPMIGLGLLEAIHPGDVLAAADPDDADGDGISGRAALLRDPATGEERLGRFGWKAAEPTVTDQVARAFLMDMGLSTPLHPDPAGDCTVAEAACRARPGGDDAMLGPEEVPADVLALAAFYARHLAVPVRRAVADADVLAGKRLFHEIGCAACHRPKAVTRRDAADPALAFQLIWPYTDLLLHDMGEGLADGRREGAASDREWRTPPLWGLGLTATVGAGTGFLHDGRARSLEEAILWHGGEAGPAARRFADLAADDRARLLAFLSSL